MNDYEKSKRTVKLNVKKVSKRARELYAKYREQDRITERQLQALANEICKSLRIPQIKVMFIGRQPATFKMNHRSHQTVTTSKTLGSYCREPFNTSIIIYRYTAVKKKEVSPKTAINALLHEIMHHWDYEKLGVKKSKHTSGFYQRISLLKEMLSSPLESSDNQKQSHWEGLHPFYIDAKC